MANSSPSLRSSSINIRIAPEMLRLVDRAARAMGKTRSGFMLDAVKTAAEEALLDQTYIQVDRETYNHFLAALDQPPSGEGFERLMAAKKPWSP